MIMNFYIDESGNTGGLARPGARFDFGGQQIFALACLGVVDESALAAELERLRQSYRIRSPELNSSSVAGKSRLITELAAFIRSHHLPMMIELVDKRFMIAANVINTLVLPPVGDCDLAPESQWLRNQMAEYVHANAPQSAFEAYVAACNAPSAVSVTHAFRSMLEWLDARAQGDEIAEALRLFTADSFGDFLELGPENETAQRRFLPLPDIGKRGQLFWMLPNLSSLTNIYARINKFRAGRIAGVTIVHDEQAHFDDILLDAKAMAESLAREGFAPPQPHADYRFEEQATLTFAQSHRSHGIQAADLLAGFIMRHAKAVLHDGKTPQSEAAEAFQALIDLCNPALGLGVNLVLSSADIKRLLGSS